MAKKEVSKKTPHSRATPKKRIHLIDEVRGAAVILMIVFHIFFTAGEIYGCGLAHVIYEYLQIIEPVISVTFIFISGICTRLSRSNLKRGIILFAIALGINFITGMIIPEFAIRFGVINLLSVCMILYGLTEKLLERINPVVGLIISFVLFMLTWGINYGYIGVFGAYRLFELPDSMYQTNYLFPLGFRNSTFRSGDYFPLFPWVFLFLSGSFFARLFNKKKLPKTFYKIHAKFLCLLGKYSLIIYITHQPIIYGIFYAIEQIG